MNAQEQARPAKPVRRIGLAPFYNLLQAPRGFSLGAHHYPIVAGLEDPRVEQLLTLVPPGAGKSELLSVVYPAYELGHDPTLTAISISAGENLPQSFMSAVMQIVQHDPAWKELFPDVRPDPELGWSLQRGLFVKGHHRADKDASYKAYGLQSKMLTGAHARLHVYDDLHDEENAGTPEMRAEVKRKYYSLLEGRADPRGSRRVGVGRWWAPDDLYQEWIASGDWVVLQLPAVRPGQKHLYYDVYVPRGLECVYAETCEPAPEHEQDSESTYVRYRAYFAAVDPTARGFYWPAMPSKCKEYERIERRQPRTARIGYRGEMASEEDLVFRESDFRGYVPPVPLDQGVSVPGFLGWMRGLHGDVEQAWDTSFGQPQSESMTASITGLFVPCDEWHCGEDPELVGPCDRHFDVYLLDLAVDDPDFRELAAMLRRQNAKWRPRRVTVEEKASGISLVQTFRGGQIPIRGQKVEQGKLERAINPVLRGEDGLPIPGGAASVQGWARMGRVLVPAGAEWVRPLLTKVCAFRGGTRVTDEFDALVHLVTRAIVRSVRKGLIASTAGTPAPDEQALLAMQDPRRGMMDAIAHVPHMPQENPFGGMCGSPCTHHGVVENREWCVLHGRPTTAIGGCADWAPRAAA